jgi:hypothetical protein
MMVAIVLVAHTTIVVNMDLTPEQLFAYLANTLDEGKVSSAENPDGIFFSVEEKKQIIEYFDEKNRIRNK